MQRSGNGTKQAKQGLALWGTDLSVQMGQLSCLHVFGRLMLPKKKKKKTQPNSHGNSPCWNQHQTAQRWVICFFGSCAYPFFSVSSQSQFGSGLVEELCRGQTSRASMLRLLWRLLLMVTKVKHSKAHQAAVAFSCQLLRITSVCCGLRRYILSRGSLTNDVAFSEWWPVIILTKYAYKWTW